MKPAIDTLEALQWSAGNFQCPWCLGLSLASKLPYGRPPTEYEIGHKADCALAASLAALGKNPKMVGESGTPKSVDPLA